MLAERLPVHEPAELLEYIQRQHIDIIDRTLDVLLDVIYLLPHLELLVSGIEVYEKVIEKVSTLGVLEFLAAQLLVKLFHCHRFHNESCFSCSILYWGRKHA